MILQLCWKKFYKLVYILASTMPQSARTIVVQNGPYCLQGKLHGCELQYWTLEICFVSNCLKFQTGTDRWIWSLGDFFNSYNPFAFAILVPILPYLQSGSALERSWMRLQNCRKLCEHCSSTQILPTFLVAAKKWPSCDEKCWLMLWQHTFFNPSQSYPPLHWKSEQSSTSAPSCHKCFPHPSAMVGCCWCCWLIQKHADCLSHKKGQGVACWSLAPGNKTWNAEMPGKIGKRCFSKKSIKIPKERTPIYEIKNHLEYSSNIQKF